MFRTHCAIPVKTKAHSPFLLVSFLNGPPRFLLSSAQTFYVMLNNFRSSPQSFHMRHASGVSTPRDDTQTKSNSIRLLARGISPTRIRNTCNLAERPPSSQIIWAGDSNMSQVKYQMVMSHDKQVRSNRIIISWMIAWNDLQFWQSVFQEQLNVSSCYIAVIMYIGLPFVLMKASILSTDNSHGSVYTIYRN